jgi:SAM-dependent methyltransferase
MGELRESTLTMDHARIRYLEAKRTVDDRALNRRVRDRLLETLPAHPEITEFGAGTGVTVPRLFSWGVTAGQYLGIDRDEELVVYAKRERAAELTKKGYAVSETDDGFCVETEGNEISVEFAVGNVLNFERNGADLVIAHAFADLVPHEDLVDALARVLTPGGLAYLPITFDGVTLFQPDHPADKRIERAYHDHIAEQEGRDPQAGRHLLEQFRAGDGQLLSVGASDWIVTPTADGYLADEQDFLECILDFVAESVREAAVDGADEWLETRRSQLASGELTYVAHQYDLLYAP